MNHNKSRLPLHNTLQLFATALCLLLFSLSVSANTKAAPFDWATFDRILKAHVSSGSFQGIKAKLVDYKALLDNTQFNQLGRDLASFNPNHLNRNEKLAFYINAYNYFAIKIVVDHWPVEGIKDIGSLFRPVWKKTAGNINGQAITLDQIEHKILRPMGEERIHFAIVCSSMSCPDLRGEIYTAEKLEQQLEDQVKLFLANDTKGATVKNGKLYLSEIFDWFEQDFEPAGVIGFIGAYRSEIKSYSDYETLDYNWLLNTQRQQN